jgi:hypothetical protein
MNKLVLLTLLPAALTVSAQNNPAVNQATTAQQNREVRDLAPGDTIAPLYAEEDSDLGPQTVLRKKKHNWFRGSVDAQVFFTDNLLYEKDGQDDGGVAVTSIEAAFMTPPCITKFASYRAEVGYRHQFFNYFGHDDVTSAAGGIVRDRTLDADDFDFDSSTAFASVLAQTKHYQFRFGADYTRLLGFEPIRNDDYEEFYHEIVPRWSLQRNFRVCDKSMFSLAYLGSYHFSDEDPPVIFSRFGPTPRSRDFPSDRSERWEHTFLASYSVRLPGDFVAQPYYRFQYTDYVNPQAKFRSFGGVAKFDESLYLHTVGFSLGWFPCENFGARAFAGYNWQQAKENTQSEYEKLDLGAGIAATLRF